MIRPLRATSKPASIICNKPASQLASSKPTSDALFSSFIIARPFLLPSAPSVVATPLTPADYESGCVCVCGRHCDADQGFNWLQAVEGDGDSDADCGDAGLNFP